MRESGRHPPLTNLKVHAAVLAGYSLLAIAWFWPLASHPNSRVPHDLGDPLGYVWILWWNSVATPFTTAWLNTPFFHPSTGAMVFQDAFLGVWPLTTPLHWLGLSPVAVPNILLIASFPASAFTAYLLCAYLVRNRVAAFAGGLVFGFAIFRIAQLAHVIILLTWWVPLIFLALHLYLDTRRSRWLLAAGAAWALQGVTGGYSFVFSAVLIGFWAIFFFRGRLLEYAKLGAVLAVSLGAIWPVFSLYFRVHGEYGFRRVLAEAEHFGADLGALAYAPPALTVWGRWLGHEVTEGQFFPGLALTVCILGAIGFSRYWSGAFWTRRTSWLVGLTALLSAVAAVSFFAPGSYNLGVVEISLTRPYKPLSWVWIAALLALLSSAPVVRLFRDRSVPGFYALAAFLMWILSMGPTISFHGYRLWYKAPYSWFAMLPGAGTVRVPARFWMLVLLALAVVSTFVLAKLARARPQLFKPVAVVFCAALIIEGWPGRMPWPTPPDRNPALEVAGNRDASVPVLELPLREPAYNYAAMYRAVFHRRPLINGASGHEPRSFGFLIAGVTAGDSGVLLPFAERSPVDIVIDHSSRDEAHFRALATSAGAVLTHDDGRFATYRLAQRPPPAAPPLLERLPVANITQEGRGDVSRILADDDPESKVDLMTLLVTLDGSCRVEEVQLGVEPAVSHADITSNGQPIWSGPLSETGARAALATPRDPRLRLRIQPIVTTRLEIRTRAIISEAYLSHVTIYGSGCAK